MTDKELSDKDCKTISDAITNPETFKTDAHLDKVMGEFEKVYENCSGAYTDSFRRILPKACRSYALGILEEALRQSVGITNKLTSPPQVVWAVQVKYLEAIIKRLSDKGPE